MSGWIDMAAEGVCSRWPQWEQEAGELSQVEQDPKPGEAHLIECVRNYLGWIYANNSRLSAEQECGATNPARMEEVGAPSPATHPATDNPSREAKAGVVKMQEPPPSCVPSDPQAQLALSAMNKIREMKQDGKPTVTLFECEVSALLAQHTEAMTEAISYTETVDALLDGIIPTRKDPNDPNDPTSQQIWLKERVQLLIDQNESTADKLSDCWILLDEIAHNAPKMTSVRAECEKLLRKHQCPGWKRGSAEDAKKVAEAKDGKLVNISTIPGKPEGREGVWLITKETAVALIEALPGNEVHNFIGQGPFIGATWEKHEAVAFFDEHPEVRIAMVFEPNVHMRHHLVALNEERRWSFDVGAISEDRMTER